LGAGPIRSLGVRPELPRAAAAHPFFPGPGGALGGLLCVPNSPQPGPEGNLCTACAARLEEESTEAYLRTHGLWPGDEIVVRL
jgi:hypothetical protein